MKIFRKFRQSALDKKKVLKYILYAIGEIALIFIGIVIAIRFESTRDEQKREEKFEIIFTEIQENLSNDIDHADYAIESSIIRDSLCLMVLNEEVTEDHYRENKMFPFLITDCPLFMQSRGGFENLQMHKELMPKKYAKLMPPLDSVYNYYTDRLKYETDMLTERTNEWGLKMKDSKAWYWKWHRDGLQDEQMDYYLNDDFYKNDVTRYRIRSTWFLLPAYVQYKDICFRLYKSIQKLNGTNPSNI